MLGLPWSVEALFQSSQRTGNETNFFTVMDYLEKKRWRRDEEKPDGMLCNTVCLQHTAAVFVRNYFFVRRSLHALSGAPQRRIFFVFCEYLEQLEQTRREKNFALAAIREGKSSEWWVFRL